MKPTAIIIIASMVATSPVMAAGAKFDTAEQFHAVSQVANAYAQASFCDGVTVDLEGTEKYLAGKFGADYHFTGAQMVHIAFLAIGARALIETLSFGGPRATHADLQKYCTNALRMFGPSGTEIRGLLME